MSENLIDFLNSSEQFQRRTKYTITPEIDINLFTAGLAHQICTDCYEVAKSAPAAPPIVIDVILEKLYSNHHELKQEVSFLDSPGCHGFKNVQTVFRNANACLEITYSIIPETCHDFDYYIEKHKEPPINVIHDAYLSIVDFLISNGNQGTVRSIRVTFEQVELQPKTT